MATRPIWKPSEPKERSDGATASYYELPEDVTELYQLINHCNMGHNIATIFSECYRYGKADHCDELRGAKKILAYAQFEVERLTKEKKAPNQSFRYKNEEGKTHE